jgi:hypothetical protein
MARRKKPCKCPRPALGALGEAVHVTHLYMGHTKPSGAGGGKLDADEKQRVIDVVKRVNGAATVVESHGYYIDKKNESFDEDSRVFTVVTRGTAKCERVIAKGRQVAAELAKIGQQSSVLAVTTCADGKVDGELVDQTGRPEKRLDEPWDNQSPRSRR